MYWRMNHKGRTEKNDFNKRQQRLLMEQLMEENEENDEELIRRQLTQCIKQKQDQIIQLQQIRIRYIICT